MADSGTVRRALELTRAARRTHLLRVLREVGVVGDRPATREAAVTFREALAGLGTTFVKLGQLLSSRPDLLPDVCAGRHRSPSATRRRAQLLQLNALTEELE